MKQVRNISFIGAGALAGGIAKLLRAKGFTIAEIVSRETAESKRKAKRLAKAVGAKTATLKDAELACDVLWLAVPDEAIEDVAEDVARVLAPRAEVPHVILHASSALSSRALAALRRRAETGSAHPMMTFVDGEAPAMRGAWFAVEGSAEAVRAARMMARKLGAKSFLIRPESKVLYHAFGAMLSPMLASELQAAERLGRRAGIGEKDVRRIMEPIVMRTVRNVMRNGAGKSFSGPLARGDVRTVAGHLKSLGGSAEGAVYRALMEYAMETLPVKRGGEMKKLLGRGRG